MVEKIELNTMVHIGMVPDIQKALGYLEDEKHHLIIVTRTEEDDKAMLDTKDTWEGKRVSWAKWGDDMKLQCFLFDNISMFVGAEIGGDKEGASDFATVLGKVANLVNFDLHSGKFLKADRPPIRNAFLNAPQIFSSTRTLATELDRHKGKPGILVGAGPSLDDQLDNLKRLQGDTIIACVGRTLRLLQKNGIEPDYVVECEQFEWDKAVWKGADTSKAVLCYPAIVANPIISEWKGERMCIVDHALKEIMKWEHSLNGGNSVAHHVLNCLAWFGCDPIIMVGIDLGYPKGIEQTHATDTTPEDWPEEIIKSENLPQQELNVEAYDGSTLRASFAYSDFKSLFEILVSKTGKRVFNTNPKAQKILGTEVMDLTSFSVSSPSPSSRPEAQPQPDPA